MTPMLGLGALEIGLIIIVALLLFGGSRLAGLGKGAGRAIRDFKEEVGADKKEPDVAPTDPPKRVEGGEPR